MPRFLVLGLRLLPLLALSVVPDYPVSAAAAQGRIVSEHVVVRIPQEREWLGRESIVALEQCWRFIHGATGEKLPRAVLVQIEWDGTESSAGYRNSSVIIGVGHPAAAADRKAFLLRSAAREMALLALAELSKGATIDGQGRMLARALAEILGREFDRSTRAFSAAWLIARHQDRIRPLSLAALLEANPDPGSRWEADALSAAVTFMLYCRQRFGRDSALKLVENLRKGSVDDAMRSALRTSAALVESGWLESLRSQTIPEEITVTRESEAPALRQTTLGSEARAGSELEIRLQMEDAGRDLSPRGVFLVDDHSGRVLQGDGAAAVPAFEARFEIPIEGSRAPGRYEFTVRAADSAGNIRQWKGAYEVRP